MGNCRLIAELTVIPRTCIPSLNALYEHDNLIV